MNYFENAIENELTRLFSHCRHTLQIDTDGNKNYERESDEEKMNATLKLNPFPVQWDELVIEFNLYAFGIENMWVTFMNGDVQQRRTNKLKCIVAWVVEWLVFCISIAISLTAIGMRWKQDNKVQYHRL